MVIGIAVIALSVLAACDRDSPAAPSQPANVGLSIAPPESLFVSTPAAFRVTLVESAQLAATTMDFGDGSTVALGTVAGGATVTHLFSRSCVFRVTVTGLDGAGAAVSTSTQVAVSALDITARVASGSLSANTATTLEVAVVPGTASIDSFRWDFGDGSSPIQTASRQVSHVYREAGIWTVTVTALPTAGNEVVSQVQFRVSAGDH